MASAQKQPSDMAILTMLNEEVIEQVIDLHEKSYGLLQ